MPAPRKAQVGRENREVTNVPIACTLTADAMVDRLAEWSAFLSSMVRKVSSDPDHATLTLVGGTEPLLTAADLAEREKACCPFFDFTFEWDQSETLLHVGVPREAESILAGLLALLPAHLAPVSS